MCDGKQSNQAECCSTSNPCVEGHGDCDADSECIGNLICGTDNCVNFPSSASDCCYMRDEDIGYQKFSIFVARLKTFQSKPPGEMTLNTVKLHFKEG